MLKQSKIVLYEELVVLSVVSEPRFGSETQVSHRYTGAYGSLGVPRGA
jgi:hypothetical protein